MHAVERDILEVELPRGWTMTLGRRGDSVGFHALYRASCGGVLLVSLDGGELSFEARGLRAVDEAVVAARTLLEDLRGGSLSGRVV